MTTCNPTHPPLRRQTAPSTAPMPDARPWRRGQAPKPRSGAPKAQGLKATIAVAASSPAPSVTQANLANLNSAAAEVPMNAAVTSQIYTSLTDTTEYCELEGRLDFRRAVLRRAYLSGAHLEGAVLDELHLQGAFLQRAHLERARLTGAHLEGATRWSAGGGTTPAA